MDQFQDELTCELNHVGEKLKNVSEINTEDMQVILLGLLYEEDTHENK